MSRISGNRATRTVRTKWKSANVLDVVIMDSIDQEMVTFSLNYSTMLVEVNEKKLTRQQLAFLIDTFIEHFEMSVEAKELSLEDAKAFGVWLVQKVDEFISLKCVKDDTEVDVNEGGNINDTDSSEE